jgi:type I restriction enzyme, R subunit
VGQLQLQRGILRKNLAIELLHKLLNDELKQRMRKNLVETVRKNATIDWTVRETVRARLRVMVKRILRKYGYPPDKQEKATQTVLEQAEVIAKDWAE